MGFRLDNLNDQRIWWKLFRSDFPACADVKLVFIARNWPETRKAAVLASFPGSDHEFVDFVSDDQDVWSKVSSRGFCSFADGSLLMIGPPTEDAWEQFSELYAKT